VAEAADVTLTLATGGAVATLAFLLATTDPAKRREAMAAEAGGDEMDSVRKYFDTTGFERWNKIYGTTDVRGLRWQPGGSAG